MSRRKLVVASLGAPVRQGPGRRTGVGLLIVALVAGGCTGTLGGVDGLDSGTGPGDADADVDVDGDVDADADGDADTEPDGDGPDGSSPRAWQPLRLDFVGPMADELAADPNPFLDSRLQVAFTGPSGQRYVVPGFFAGDGEGGSSGRLWSVWLTPDEAGAWSYEVSFRQGPRVAIDLDPDAGTPTDFDGTAGGLEVAPRDPEAPGFLSRGRLVHEAGSAHLRTMGDGRYWLKGGTDSPENMLAYAGFEGTSPSPDPGGEGRFHDFDAHEGDFRPGDPDWGDGQGRGIIGALNYLADQGVNSVYLLLMNIGGDGQDVFPYAGEIDRAGGDGANDDLFFDLGKLAQWEVVFAHAERLGIHLHLVLNEGELANKHELDEGTLGVERRLYYREMVARFAHHNAITWNLSEEYDLTARSAIPPDEIRAWAGYLRAVDPYDHPITVHNCAADAWDPFFGAPELDAVSYQHSLSRGGPGAQVERLAAGAAAAGWPVAVHIDETCTADPADDDSHEIEDMGSWERHVCGQRYMRRNIIYPIYFSGGGVELILNGTLQTDDFRSFEPVWRSMAHARQLLEDHLPFHRMVPADHLLEGEAPGDLEGGQVLAAPGEVYAVYLPRGGSASLSVQPAEYTLRWYDPRTGELVGDLSTRSGARLDLGSPPYEEHEDWVALLEWSADVEEGVFHTEGGEVAIEAEHYSDSPGGWTFHDTIGGESFPSNPFLGDGYMRAAAMCRSGPWCGQLDYLINFREAGTYYLHLRTASYQPEANSVRLAVDGIEVYDNIFTGGGRHDWGFQLTTCRCVDCEEGERGLDPFPVEIATTGMHTISVGVREELVSLDRIWLSMSDADCYRDRDAESPDPALFVGP